MVEPCVVALVGALVSLLIFFLHAHNSHCLYPKFSIISFLILAILVKGCGGSGCVGGGCGGGGGC